GAWSASLGPLSSYDTPIRTGVPVAISLVGVWVAFRLVNYPPFADFLISVEGEMDKVSWASWPELYRATIVVILTMVFLGAVLYAYDLIWYNILSALRVLRV